MLMEETLEGVESMTRMGVFKCFRVSNEDALHVNTGDNRQINAAQHDGWV